MVLQIHQDMVGVLSSLLSLLSLLGKDGICLSCYMMKIVSESSACAVAFQQGLLEYQGSLVWVG